MDVPHIRRLHQEDAVLVKLKAGGGVEVVKKVDAFVGVAGVLGVFEDQDAVADL